MKRILLVVLGWIIASNNFAVGTTIVNMSLPDGAENRGTINVGADTVLTINGTVKNYGTIMIYANGTINGGTGIKKLLNSTGSSNFESQIAEASGLSYAGLTSYYRIMAIAGGTAATYVCQGTVGGSLNVETFTEEGGTSALTAVTNLSNSCGIIVTDSALTISGAAEITEKRVLASFCSPSVVANTQNLTFSDFSQIIRFIGKQTFYTAGTNGGRVHFTAAKAVFDKGAIFFTGVPVTLENGSEVTFSNAGSELSPTITITKNLEITGNSTFDARNRPFTIDAGVTVTVGGSTS
ncbi:MAG: hypothetical protein LBF56_01775 [Holosporales bacterium]|jgi:hypothetical protein|nr:hypothetical protein [Holosporales bacterium]